MHSLSPDYAADLPSVEPCDFCGRPRINQLDPVACQCPDDEPAECEGCHEEAATLGTTMCPTCRRITAESRRCAERAAENAEKAGHPEIAAYIRSAA